MYKVDFYTDNHVRCGERVVPLQNSKNLFMDFRIIKNRVIRDDTHWEGKLQL